MRTLCVVTGSQPISINYTKLKSLEIPYRLIKKTFCSGILTVRNVKNNDLRGRTVKNSPIYEEKMAPLVFCSLTMKTIFKSSFLLDELGMYLEPIECKCNAKISNTILIFKFDRDAAPSRRRKKQKFILTKSFYWIFTEAFPTGLMNTVDELVEFIHKNHSVLRTTSY